MEAVAERQDQLLKRCAKQGCVVMVDSQSNSKTPQVFLTEERWSSSLSHFLHVTWHCLKMKASKQEKQVSDQNNCDIIVRFMFPFEIL